MSAEYFVFRYISRNNIISEQPNLGKSIFSQRNIESLGVIIWDCLVHQLYHRITQNTL